MEGNDFGPEYLKHVNIVCEGDNFSRKIYTPNLTLLSRGGIPQMLSNGNKGQVIY